MTSLEISNRDLVNQYDDFITSRRANVQPARIFGPNPEDAREIAAMIAAGGLVVMPWWQKSRSTLFLATVHDNTDSTQLLNIVKGRPMNQTLAISYLPESVDTLVDLGGSIPLNAAADRMDKTPTEVLNECYRLSVGLMFRAIGELPETVTMDTNNGRTVILMGAINEDGYDTYNGVLSEVFRSHGKAIAGSSLNGHTKNVYAVSEQAAAYHEFKRKVDGIVLYDQIPEEPAGDPPASSTLIDLTGERALIFRKGSVDGPSLAHIFPELVSA